MFTHQMLCHSAEERAMHTYCTYKNWIYHLHNFKESISPIFPDHLFSFLLYENYIRLQLSQKKFYHAFISYFADSLAFYV